MILNILRWPLALLAGISIVACAQSKSPVWRPSDPGFRSLAIASDGKNIWVCGVGERIASSSDGVHWAVRHQAANGELLLGISFRSEKFGYAFGTGGTLLITEDGGESWTVRRLGEQPILTASLADRDSGLFRTREALYRITAVGQLPIPIPSTVPSRFTSVQFLAAASPQKMGVLLSEGPHAESGFLTTVDGGKIWSFYDPPSTGVKAFLQVDGKYWATGHRVVNGGASPLAIYSSDGVSWSQTDSDIRPCHWEICGICTSTGCIASGNLLADFFHGAVTYSAIPDGQLTAKWASIPGTICSIHDGVFCAPLGVATDVLAQPRIPQPSEQNLPPLGTKQAQGILRCIVCSVEPAFVDDHAQGRFNLHIELVVRPDGTVDSAKIDGAPSPSIRDKVQAQISDWLFEPPRKDGKGIRVSTKSDLAIMVIKAR